MELCILANWPGALVDVNEGEAGSQLELNFCLASEKKQSMFLSGAC